MAVKELTFDNFHEEVLASDVPVVVDFFADWCGPCQMMAPAFHELSDEFDGELKFMKLDTQVEQGLASNFKITGIPALLVFSEGKEVGRIVGFAPKEMLKAKIENVLSQL